MAEHLPRTGFWQRIKARFMPPVDQDGLPATLVDRFGANTLLDRVARVLKFLSQLTAAF